MKLVFPKHYVQSPNDFVGRAAFVAHYASLAGIDVHMVENKENVWMQRKVRGKGWVPSKGNHLSCMYKGKRLIFECSDFPHLGKLEEYEGIPCFKFHYSQKLHDDMKHVFPVGPSMLLPAGLPGFRSYYAMRETYEYTCANDVISNKQEPRRLALERRTRVQKMLRKRYGKDLDCNWRGTQGAFWRNNQHCLASVCVPGACNNMLDRGHYELIGLGVCTISPFIPTILPWNRILVPDQHYIVCKDDYSDLIEKIEWCRDNRQRCVEIGNNAKDLFTRYCTPDKYWEWIDHCMEKV